MGQHCSDLDVFWLLAVLTAVFEPIAFAVHLKDVDVMGQTIQQCACEPFGTKDFGPLIERQVRGNYNGAAFVALGYHLEEQLGARFAEGHEAQLVDDQQVLAG